MKEGLRINIIQHLLSTSCVSAFIVGVSHRLICLLLKKRIRGGVRDSNGQVLLEEISVTLETPVN